MEVVRDGASFLRFQMEELVWMQEPVDDVFRKTLLMVAGGSTVAPFACFAVDDILSQGWQATLAESPLASQVASDGELEPGADELPRGRMAKAAERLLPMLLALRPPMGFFCNALALDSQAWDPTHASKFELQELWAAALAGKRLLLVMGEGAPAAESFAPVLRQARGAAAHYVDSNAVMRGFADLVAEIAGQAENYDTVLVLGLSTGLGALLVAALDCSLQVLDLGQFRVLPAPRRIVTPSTFVTQCSGGPCSRDPDADPWGGPGFHPRPQLRRPTSQWANLNGPWEVHISMASERAVPTRFDDGSLRVPFPAESSLGGLRRRISEYEALWLRREVEIPVSWPRVLLHVDACDWECSIFVNGRFLSTHRGGYDPFVVDISAALPPLTNDESNPVRRRAELVIRAWDPTDSGCDYVVVPPVPCRRCCTQGWQPRGKQTLQPGFIMYSAATGPWQTVWLEEAKEHCMLRSAQAILLNGEEAVQGAAASVRFEASLEEALGPCGVGARLVVAVFLDGKELAGDAGEGPFAVKVSIPGPVQLWSPETPVLYRALLALCESDERGCRDTVEITFGLRWLSHSRDDEVGPKMERDLLLNGKRLLQHGVLYQAYWPESLIAPPGHAALADEVRQIKESGFNLIRVHAAVMPASFYDLCDRIGILVWQDFPGGDSRALPLWDHARASVEEQTGAPPLEFDEIVRTEESATAFWTELQAMVSWLSAFACVVCWIPFNEAWGQFQTMQVVRWLRDFGGGRWINAASGWNDVSDLFPGQDAGDLADVHNYEGPPFNKLNGTFTTWPLPYTGRALALGEYGGLGLPMDGHEWAPDSSWAYGNVSTTSEELGQSLLALAGRLAALLCESRISAAIYTQWNDIETEVNGLVSYDRVPKVPTAVLREFSAIVAEAHERCRPSPDASGQDGVVQTG